MSKQRIKDFIDKQLENLEDSFYEIESDENHIYALFIEVLGKKVNLELTFKILDNVLYLHSIAYGWKPIEKGDVIKYFWIELLKQ